MRLTTRGWAVLLTLVAVTAFVWGALGWTLTGPMPTDRKGPAIECRAHSTTLCPRP